MLAIQNTDFLETLCRRATPLQAAKPRMPLRRGASFPNQRRFAGGWIDRIQIIGEVGSVKLAFGASE